MIQSGAFSLTYRFQFPDGLEKEFLVQLDRKNCSILTPERDVYPEWTRLKYKQCRQCPLNSVEHPRCPVAVNIVEIVEFFQDFKSVETAIVEVETPQRVTKGGKTALFPAISSLIGIYMVTSGCPVLDKLRPMARFHLPFADTEETVYRALSMYALAQYFRHKKGGEADWDFEGLKEIYRNINRLNIDFAKRLHNESISEATTNAITSLDCFAQEIDFSISESMLEEIEGLFDDYLNNDQS
ncbi:hypothetical protein SH580_04680 [Coraliomargarita algicola]|uniref:Uncharacterized protein n=1 Tax=Coraliomargarita algicola TaxID=3092156 RepID=A0ABZ0RLB2_9BACT|nr:hypothetical protein [Coraliomargarita sp. J2-16]WPJ97001.1 hypothetical protein SH580_04680 [Coraliomargarita sp. J2-16]